MWFITSHADWTKINKHRGSVVHKLAVMEAQIDPARAGNCTTITQSASVVQVLQETSFEALQEELECKLEFPNHANHLFAYQVHAADSYPANVNNGLGYFAEAYASRGAFASACAVHIHLQTTTT